MVLSGDPGPAVAGHCLGLGLSLYWTLSILVFKVIQVATVVISRAPKPTPMRCISLPFHLSSDMLPGWHLTLPHLF